VKPEYRTCAVQPQAGGSELVTTVFIPAGTFEADEVRFEGTPQPTKKAAEAAAAAVALSAHFAAYPNAVALLTPATYDDAWGAVRASLAEEVRVTVWQGDDAGVAARVGAQK
jgi:hypothetical protein